MQRTSCPLCNSEESRYLWSKEGAHHEKCTSCGLTYENPRLTDEQLKELYSAEKYFLDDSAAASVPGYVNYFAQCTESLAREYFRILQTNLPKLNSVSFLDVGCGPGILLEEAQRHGWRATGVELSRWAAEQGQKKNLHILEGTLLDVGFAGGVFDIISMFDVLEHLPRPSEYMREIRRILKPRGIFVAETPNANGFFARHFDKESSEIVKPRAHVCLYSPATARYLLKQAGFREWNISPFPYCRSYTPGYFKRLILSRFGNRVPVQLTWNESMRIVAST